jgi:dynactin 1
MASVDYPLGTIVELGQALGRGVIRFSGATSFRPGKWVGIELYDAKGKNDGSVDGVAYFSCKPNHGVFVRAMQIKETFGNERDELKKQQPAGRRPGLGHGRSDSLSKTTLLRPSPSIASTASSPRSGSASPTKAARAGSNGSQTPASASAKRMSLQRTVPLKQATTGSPPGPSSGPKSPPMANGAPRVSSPLALPPSSPVTSELSPTHSRPESELPSTAPASPAPAPPVPATPATATANGNGNVPTVSAEELAIVEKEITELRSKVRFLEAKRQTDTISIRELTQKLADAEQFIAIRPKLQAKLQSLQTDLTSAKRDLSDAVSLKEMAERRAVDVEELLEIALLDKEVAEEKAEAAENELEEVKENLAIAEVELEVLKEEQAAIEEAGNQPDEEEEEETMKDPSASPSKKNSAASKRAKADALAMLQLEKQNERLKEALIRLRDMTQETDMEQKRRIADMARDMGSFDDVAGSFSLPLSLYNLCLRLLAKFETTQIQLSNAEVQIEDLKLQLDDALGAEELVVQLTERNLMLSEVRTYVFLRFFSLC